MGIRDFVTWHEAAKLIDDESLRQLILRESLPAFVEMDSDSGFAYAAPADGGEYPSSGRTALATWQAQDFDIVPPGYDWTFDDDKAYSLRGWFLLSHTTSESVFRRIPATAFRYVRPAEDGENPGISYEKLPGRGFRLFGDDYGYQALWFRQVDLDRLRARDIATDALPAPVLEADKPLEARERASLLRIIRALVVMAKADGRGTATAIEKQLQQLGLDGPKEATIRSILKQAIEGD